MTDPKRTGGPSSDGLRDERDSEPATLATESGLTKPIDDEGGEIATAVADARVLRQMIARVQAEQEKSQQEEEEAKAIPKPRESSGLAALIQGTLAGEPDKVPTPPPASRHSEAPTRMRNVDSIMSEAPTNPPPALNVPLPPLPPTLPLPADDDDGSERTVATESPEMLGDQSGEATLARDLETARELMRQQLESESELNPPTRPNAPAPLPVPAAKMENTPPPQSARVSLPGAQPDDIDPYDATIARPPDQAQQQASRAAQAQAMAQPQGPAYGSQPNIAASSPLASSVYRPPGGPTADPLAMTAYQVGGQPSGAATSSLAQTGYQPPNAQPRQASQPQIPQNAPSTMTVPLAFQPPGAPLPQTLPAAGQPPMGPMPAVQMGQPPHPMNAFPPPTGPQPPARLPPPTVQVRSVRDNRVGSQMSIIIVVACVLAATIGVILIILARHH